MSLRFLVLGAGGVGGYFGARLTEGGVDTTFLVRGPRRDRLNEGGIRIHSDFFDDAEVPSVKAVTAEELDAPFDVILLTCKAYQLDAAMDTIAPAVGPDTSILPVLNGMKQIDMLQARFGEERVLGGTTYIGARLDAETGDRPKEVDVADRSPGRRDEDLHRRTAAFPHRWDAGLRPGFGAGRRRPRRLPVEERPRRR